MATKQSTARKQNTQQSPQKLTVAELERLTEKLAVALEHDGENVALMTLLLDQLEQTRETDQFFKIVHTVKRHLFNNTIEADDACEQFRVSAYANRGKLLLWPRERKGVA